MTSETALHPFELLLAIDKRNRAQLPAAAPPQAEGGMNRLAVRVGAWRLLFAMEEVAEIIPIPRITRVPGVKAWLLGIANLRGAVMTVVDVRAFLLGEMTSLAPSSRLLVVCSGEWSYGLLVDEMLGMRPCAPASEPIPTDRIHTGLHPYITAHSTSEQTLWLCFSVSRLLQNAEFLQAVI